ncbi:type-1 angiotensin II receptor-associated protein isoform X2 [Lithobates pipiens]
MELPAVSLKAIVYVHWLLTMFACTFIWLPNAYYLSNLTVLAVGIWAIIQRDSVDAIFMCLQGLSLGHEIEVHTRRSITQKDLPSKTTRCPPGTKAGNTCAHLSSPHKEEGDTCGWSKVAKVSSIKATEILHGDCLPDRLVCY